MVIELLNSCSSIQKDSSSSFTLLPTEVVSQIFEEVVDHYDIEVGEDYINIVPLSVLMDVCTTWESTALFIAKLHSHFRFNDLCDFSALERILTATYPSLISISLDFPNRLPPASYWRFLIALFQHSSRFIDFSVTTVPSNYLMLCKNLIDIKLLELETLRFTRIEELQKGETVSKTHILECIPVPAFEVDFSKLRHLHLDRVEWHGYKQDWRKSRTFSKLESIFIRKTNIGWISTKGLDYLTVSGTSDSGFRLRGLDSPASGPPPTITNLRIDNCAPCWVFWEGNGYNKASVRTLVFSNMTSTNWINIARFIQAEHAPKFSGVKSLEISFIDSAAAACYAEASQVVYSKFYEAFENVEILKISNVHNDSYFLRALERSPHLCPGLFSVEINGRTVKRGVGFK